MSTAQKEYTVSLFGSHWASHSAAQPPRVIAAFKLLEKIEKFRAYGPNWGTYNEKAVKEGACNKCAHFISHFAFFRPHVKIQVYPTTAGDVGAQWTLGTTDFAVIFSDSDAHLFVDTEDSEEMDELVFTSEMKLLEFLKIIGFE